MILPLPRLRRQRRRPTLEFDLGQDQVLPARADRALDQPQYAAHGALHARHFDVLLAGRKTLARARVLPGRAGGRRELVVELSALDRAHGRILQTKATHRYLASPARCKPVEMSSRIQMLHSSSATSLHVFGAEPSIAHQITAGCVAQHAEMKQSR